MALGTMAYRSEGSWGDVFDGIMGKIQFKRSVDLSSIIDVRISDIDCSVANLYSFTANTLEPTILLEVLDDMLAEIMCMRD